MFKESKYYGEIWQPNNIEQTSFCVLEIKDGEIFLETNLSGDGPEYKKDLIYGKFNGLGFVTMVNNIIRHSSSGITQARIYNPEYFFSSSDHLVKLESLKIKEFKVDNIAFNDWIRQFRIYNSIDKKIEEDEKINHKIQIQDKSLELEIIKTVTYNSTKDHLMFKNGGLISFVSSKEINILESIDLYKKFQKFLLFFFGKSSHFSSFDFKCLGCGNWISMYYSDNLVVDKSSSFIKLEYKDLKDDLKEALSKWYLNEELQFCGDIIIENLLSKKVSSSRRFTNSLSAYEAYNKRFGKSHLKPTLERYLSDSKDILCEIGKIKDEFFLSFVQKIIRTRDMFVHGNKKQINCFSKLELLYISYLLDFVVGIGLAKEMRLSEANIKKIFDCAVSNYVHMQSTNKILSQNILILII